jgi:hypothetical protein
MEATSPDELCKYLRYFPDSKAVFLPSIDVEKTNHIMSPSLEAVMLSKILATAFTSSQN